ncbi:MAG: hypothetical protein KJ077_41005 [Anaerolineae bacterium]|nr:hypothetical protein [Anaerolineae bacterium]
MNNLKRWLSIALVSGLALLLLVGVLATVPALAQGGGMMGGGMMSGPGGMMGNTQGLTGTNSFGPGGMMGGMMGGPGWMMGNTQGLTGTTPYGPGGMMGNMMSGMMNSMMNGGMMGGMMVNSNSPFFTAQPLTLAEATDTLNTYLTSLNDANLELGEVMIFDNHAYAQIVEKDSGIGVMEVLVDPTSKAVFPEMGPTMMWNLKYGMMSGFGGYGMMGMMMGGMGNMMGQGTPADPSAEMSVTPEKAVEAAQTYLDTYFAEAQLTADPEASPFYGYYTLHVNQDGQTAGMLSVNGYTGQVFPHTWHGKLIEMSHE